MSTHDDQFRGAGSGASSAGAFDDSGFSTGDSSTATSIMSGRGETGKDKNKAAGTRWHGGLDLGLLILRVALGGIMGAHGLQKIFGLFDGPGIDGFSQALGGFGFSSQTTLLAWITGLSEIGGGVLVILGLFTPLGAAALLGVAVSAVCVKFSSGFFMGQQSGFEYELLLAVAALVVLLTGSGRLALDVNTPWRRKPLPYALAGIVLAAIATVLVFLLFR